MNNIKKVTDCEEIVLSIIWDADHDVDLKEIMAEAKNRYGKIWAVQTVSTFLMRLRKKGFLELERKARRSYYRALISKEVYRKEMIKILVDRFYGGDYQKLIKELQKQ